MNKTKKKSYAQRLREAAKRTRLRLRYKIFSHYGLKCKLCPESRLICLTIDHINDDGAKHRRENRTGSGDNFYYWLKRNNFPPGYQVLCHNCNWIKHLKFLKKRVIL